MAGNLAGELKPKSHIYSVSMERILLGFSINLSHRKTCDYVNSIFRRNADSLICPSTLEDYIKRQGQCIFGYFNRLSDDILSKTPWISSDGIVANPSKVPTSISTPSPESSAGTDPCEYYEDVIKPYNIYREVCDQIKNPSLIRGTEINPDDCVYVSIDDVGVKQQKSGRKDGGTRDGKVVENTVIHIQSKEGSYILTTVGMAEAFKFLIAFLLSNRLLENRHLYFFTDGANNIRKSIETYFDRLCPYTIYLDWYHLEKRMTELLSMALKGPKDIRHEIRTTLDHKLWAGNFHDAGVYIRNIEPKYVKNQIKLQEALDYLNRKQPYACCYALRKELKLRNSSNPAEKTNDLVVANRQKHNGMSWSRNGSGALATITALHRNGSMNSWIEHGVINFSPQLCSNDKVDVA